MASLSSELKRDAERAIAAMRTAAIRARECHARAELLRHVMLGAAKFQDRVREDAIAHVMEEWLAAWGLGRSACGQLLQMEALVAACYDAIRMPGEPQNGSVRAAFAMLEAAFADAGTSLADEMAWRSSCAHEWWAAVRPAPKTQIRPFWEHGCPPHCG